MCGKYWCFLKIVDKIFIHDTCCDNVDFNQLCHTNGATIKSIYI